MGGRRELEEGKRWVSSSYGVCIWNKKFEGKEEDEAIPLQAICYTGEESRNMVKQRKDLSKHNGIALQL